MTRGEFLSRSVRACRLLRATRAVLTAMAGLTIGLACSRDAAHGEDVPPARISFDTDIRPILQAKCVKCHGDKKQNAGLSLATAAALLRGGESGPVVTPGKPAESRLFEVLRDGEMPPAGATPLAEAEVERIRRWIEAGASTADRANPGGNTSANPSGPNAPPITQHDVIPILLLRCTACHGGRRREANLDLRTTAGILRGGKSGPVVVPGKPDESSLVRRIRAEEMPPRRQLVSVSVKPMEAVELRKLVAWIAAGLPETPATGPAPMSASTSAAPSAPPSATDPLVSEEDREFWSFRPPVAVPPPQVAARSVSSSPVDSPVRNAVDAFLLARLAERNLTFAPEADRATLIRRVTFDLTGLPPSPEDVAAFVADESPTAYEALVERLLASPRYGERWARHWLDVAGYADSEGAQNEDRVRPNMWRYRDYVVRAWNADKPYDRFLHEQLAGDELADYEHAPEITDELYDNLVATGFLRTAPDRTFANITNFVPDRLEVMADEMQIFGSAVLGLTLHCARCHSHKFDPLPQRDYFRLIATFKDALDEHDWLGPEARQLPHVTTAERQAWERERRDIDARIAPLQEQLKSATDDATKKRLQAEIKQHESRRQPEPKIRALWSRGDPSPTYLLRRGNYLTPGDLVEPGVPAVLTRAGEPFAFSVVPPWPGAKTTGRRLALARWLTAPGHPLTARVLVNRVWKHHFGAGLVVTLGNFGRTGAAPSHPELLDWLSVEFERSGWSLKALHRLLVTSAAYRQTSRVTADRLAADPDNRLVSRMPLRRLEAEVLRDSLLAVAGRLDLKPFGPPDGVDVRGDGLVTVQGDEQRGRRSVFVLHRRTKLPTLLENFDSPQMGPNCLERGEAIVAPQALHLFNNATVHELARHFARRVERECGLDRDIGPENDRPLTIAHELAWGRPPTPDERQAAFESLAALTAAWRESLGTAPNGAAPNGLVEARRRALDNYCHALFNSAGFLYVD